MKQAFLSAEDKNFYSHPGIDVLGILRAVVTDVMQPGPRAQGASTITQQVARNFLLSSERTFSRKIREMVLAMRIDSTLLEGQDPRAVSERDLPRREFLRRRGRRDSLFRQVAERAHARADGVHRGSAQGARELQSAAQSASRGCAPQLGSRSDAGERLHHRRRGADRGGRGARRLQSRPSVQLVADVDYFVEEVRRVLFNQYGEEGSL